MVYFGTEAKPYREEVIKDTIVESVVKQFKDRSNVGIAKYGVTLDRDDLSLIEWLEHTKQEQMDSVLYLEKAIKELKKQSIIDIMKSDEELGLYANTFSGTTHATTANILYNEELEKRMNIIGQNGNDGTHY
jgi:hypothetical protein